MGDDYGAVARLVEEEQSQRKRQMRNLVILAVAITAGMGGIVYALKEVARTQPPKVQIDVSKLPPIRPGPTS
jgi:hypothetical protein